MAPSKTSSDFMASRNEMSRRVVMGAALRGGYASSLPTLKYLA